MDCSDEVPGTELIIKTGSVDSGLRTDGELILIPQPSESVNDPLNWSSARKWWHACLVLGVVGLTAATSNSASAAQLGLEEEFPDITDNDFNNGAGVLFIAIGYWTLLSAPSVYLWGNRLSYLVGMLFGIIGNAWYANTKNSRDAIWSQLFIGASESVAEAVAQLSLSQIFFKHKLPFALGIYVFATSIGTFLGPLVGGYASDNLGWQWVGYLGLITSGFFFLLCFFGLEETYFERDSIAPRTEVLRPKQSTRSDSFGKKGDSHLRATITPMGMIEPEKGTDKKSSYWRRIALITPAANLKGFGFKQYLRRLWLILRVFTFPPVIYAGLQWGFQDAWLTFYITVEDVYWSEEPWNYGDSGVAIMNLPTLIGAFIGCIYATAFSDWLVLRLAKRNNGIMEAESRLWANLLPGIISPVGMFLFGVGTGRGWAWPAPYVGLGFIGFGFGAAGDLSLSYLADCYPDMILEGMVGVAVINNTLGMAFSFACDHWLDNIGPLNSFIAIGVVDFVVIFVFSIMMILWGKKCRRWTKAMYFNFIKDRDSLAQ